jgi:hypothetical protein
MAAGMKFRSNSGNCREIRNEAAIFRERVPWFDRTGAPSGQRL